MITSTLRNIGRQSARLIYRRVLAAGLALCLAWPAPLEAAPLDLRTKRVPESLGWVDSFHAGPSGKTIFYIQDAHDSLEIQENIAALIAQLVRQDKIRSVFEEGYEGIVPTDRYFDSKMPAGLRRAMAYYLLDQLRIGGAEYAHILRARENPKENFKLIGADSFDLHFKSVRWFQKTARQHSEAAADLKVWSHEFRRLAEKNLPGELLDYLKLKNRLDLDQIPLLDYLKRIRLLAQSDFTAPLIDSLLSNQENDIVENMQPNVFFEEIEALEKNIVLRTIQTRKQRELFYFLKAVQLLERLIDFRLSPAEYAVVSHFLETQDSAAMARFLVRHSGTSAAYSRRWEAAAADARSFYQTSVAREKTLEQNMQSFMHHSSEKNAILVYGGFHRQGIEEMLKRLGFSFYVISPRMKQSKASHQALYKHLMTNGYALNPFPEALRHASRLISQFELAAARGQAGERELRAFHKRLHAAAASLNLVKNEAFSAEWFSSRIHESLEGSLRGRSEVRAKKRAAGGAAEEPDAYQKAHELYLQWRQAVSASERTSKQFTDRLHQNLKKQEDRINRVLGLNPDLESVRNQYQSLAAQLDGVDFEYPNEAFKEWVDQFMETIKSPEFYSFLPSQGDLSSIPLYFLAAALKTPEPETKKKIAKKKRSEVRPVERIEISAKLRQKILANDPKLADVTEWEEKLAAIANTLHISPKEILEFFSAFPKVITYTADNLNRKWQLLLPLAPGTRQAERMEGLRSLIPLNTDLLELLAAEAKKQKKTLEDANHLRRLYEALNRETRRQYRKTAAAFRKEEVLRRRSQMSIFESPEEAPRDKQTKRAESSKLMPLVEKVVREHRRSEMRSQANIKPRMQRQLQAANRFTQKILYAQADEFALDRLRMTHMLRAIGGTFDGDGTMVRIAGHPDNALQWLNLSALEKHRESLTGILGLWIARAMEDPSDYSVYRFAELFPGFSYDSPEARTLLAVGEHLALWDAFPGGKDRGTVLRTYREPLLSEFNWDLLDPYFLLRPRSWNRSEVRGPAPEVNVVLTDLNESMDGIHRTTNENVGELIRALREIPDFPRGGTYVGVGSYHNLDIALAREADAVVLIDFDIHVIRLLKELLDIIGQTPYERITEALERSRPLRIILQSRGEPSFRQPLTWLRNPRVYQALQNLIQDGKILLVGGDMTSPRTVQTVRPWLVHQPPVRIVNISNVPTFGTSPSRRTQTAIALRSLAAPNARIIEAVGFSKLAERANNVPSGLILTSRSGAGVFDHRVLSREEFLKEAGVALKPPAAFSEVRTLTDLRGAYIAQVERMQAWLKLLENRTLPDILSFGDKHGRSSELKRMLKRARQIAKARGHLEIIGHGDTFDRGKNNRKNFELLKKLKKLETGHEGVRVSFLLGNHDIEMIRAVLLEQPGAMKRWQLLGGRRVVEEFSPESFVPDSRRIVINKDLQDLALWVLMNSDFYRQDALGFLHVHAGIPASGDGLPLFSRDVLEGWQVSLRRLREAIGADPQKLKSQAWREELEQLFKTAKPLYSVRPKDWMEPLSGPAKKTERLRYLSWLGAQGVIAGHTRQTQLTHEDHRFFLIDTDWRQKDKNGDAGWLAWDPFGLRYDARLRAVPDTLLSYQELKQKVTDEIQQLQNELRKTYAPDDLIAFEQLPQLETGQRIHVYFRGRSHGFYEIRGGSNRSAAMDSVTLKTHSGFGVGELTVYRETYGTDESWSVFPARAEVRSGGGANLLRLPEERLTPKDVSLILTHLADEAYSAPYDTSHAAKPGAERLLSSGLFLPEQSFEYVAPGHPSYLSFGLGRTQIHQKADPVIQKMYGIADLQGRVFVLAGGVFDSARMEFERPLISPEDGLNCTYCLYQSYGNLISQIGNQQISPAEVHLPLEASYSIDAEFIGEGDGWIYRSRLPRWEAFKRGVTNIFREWPESAGLSYETLAIEEGQAELLSALGANPRLRHYLWSSLDPMLEYFSRRMARSESRVVSQQNSIDPAAWKQPAAVFIDSHELTLLSEPETRDQMEELLLLLSRNRGLDVYVNAENAKAVQNVYWQKLIEEYGRRVHGGVLNRPRLAQKKILIGVSFVQDSGTRQQTQERMQALKQAYGLKDDILPLEYTQGGTLTGVLSLAESLQAGELIRELGALYAVRSKSGYWRLAESYLASLWSEIQNSYVVQWSA